MRHQRFIWSLLAAAVLWSSLAAPKAVRLSGSWCFLHYPSGGPFMGGPLMQPYSPYTNYYYTYPTDMPYVAPYPAYGILPPPFVTAHYYESRKIQYSSGKTAEDYGYRIDGQPRLREARYIRRCRSSRRRGSGWPICGRVRYEIEVPFANAVVYIDGAKTKQTGLKRVYVTPPMQEDRYYTATIKVEWVDQFQKTRQREQSFNFVAGQTVRAQFKE